MRISRKVVEELEEKLHDPDEDRRMRAQRAVDQTDKLGLEEIYWPRPRFGEGRYGEVRLGDPGLFHDAGFTGGDNEVVEFAAAGHTDFAKRGQVQFFVTEDKKGILKRKRIIEREAPGMKVLRLREFLEEMRDS